MHELTHARVRELFDYHVDGYLIWRSRGARAGSTNRLGYTQIQIGSKKNKKQQAHVLIWLWHHDAMRPPVVDHIDRNPRNNRIENLRPATLAQNAANARKRRDAKTSRWKGVSYQSSKGWWRAYIQHDGRLTYLGKFAHEENAALAYNFAAYELHGDFAVLNIA